MKYAVLFQRPGRVANMDEWFSTMEEAQRRCSDGPAKCWVEENCPYPQTPPELA